MVYNAFADIIERTEAGAVNPDDKDNLVARIIAREQGLTNAPAPKNQPKPELNQRPYCLEAPR